MGYKPVAPVQIFDDKALELLESFFYFLALRPSRERLLVAPAMENWDQGENIAYRIRSWSCFLLQSTLLQLIQH
jgi:hypothetical protein